MPPHPPPGHPNGHASRGDSPYTPDPGTHLGRYYTHMRGRLGERAGRTLGTLDAVTIGRYALTIGATDPFHHDRAAARAAGHADVVAPPNLLAAIFEWGAGTAPDGLGPDGTPSRADAAGDGLRAMGAGEEMEILAPAVAGMEIVEDEILDAVVAKDTRGGPCVFVTTLHVFRLADGTVLNRNRRTVVRRDPIEDGNAGESRQPARADAADGTHTKAPCAGGSGEARPPGAARELPRLTYEPTPLDLFRYSAVTWNPHRIHYEEAYAHGEGHPGVLVHSHFRAALALRCVTEGMGDGWEPVRTAYRLRRPATPGDPLVYGARARAVDGGIVELDLYEDHPSGTHGLEGTATVRRAGKEQP